MAERKAIATGNWSNVNTWDGTTTIPTTGDIVYLNGITVTADQDINLGASGEIRTTTGPNPIAGSTPVAGGALNVATTRSITANLIAGTTFVINVQNTGVLTHSGTILAGSASSAHGIALSASGSVLASHTGNVTGGTASGANGINYVAGMTNAQGSISGEITGGSNASAHGIATGGSFVGPLTINGNLVSGVGNAISIANTAWTGDTLLTVNGNVTGTGTGAAILVNATSNINVTVNGKVKAGLGIGVSATTTGTVTVNNPGQIAVEGSDNAASVNRPAMSLGGATLVVNGNVVAASAGTGSHGISIGSTMLGVTVNGDVTGGSVANVFGFNAGTTAMTAGFVCTGVVKGGSGSSATGVQTNGTQTFIFNVVEGNDAGNGVVNVQSYGFISSVDNPNVRAKVLKCGTHGMSPVQGRVQLIEDTPNSQMIVPRFSDRVMMALRPTAFSADHPAPANVRHGTVYDSGQKTGTMRVPSAASTFSGVPVDNTVGTATVTAASIRAALGMADPDLDAQLAAAAVERNSILAAVVTTNDHTDTVEASIAALPKAIHNFDCGANQGDTVPAVSLRNFVRHVFNWSITDDTKTVYKEDGTTPAYTSTVTIADGYVLGDNQT